jgi:hypothetical protein
MNFSPDARFAATVTSVLLSLGLVGSTLDLWRFPHQKLPDVIELLLPLLGVFQQPLMFVPLIGGLLWLLWIKIPRARRSSLCIGILAGQLALVCLYYHTLMVNLLVWPSIQ